MAAPKSAEVLEKIAPILSAPSAKQTTSAVFATQAATTSPSTTPAFKSDLATWLARSLTSPLVNVRQIPDSEISVITIWSGTPLSNVSTTFNLASGKNSVLKKPEPEITVSPKFPTTSESLTTKRQNFAGLSIVHLCSSE